MHPQRPPYCCYTHLSAGPNGRCWDCHTIDMADTVLGLAALKQDPTCWPGHRPKPPRTVLDALIEALDEIDQRPIHTPREWWRKRKERL